MCHVFTFIRLENFNHYYQWVTGMWGKGNSHKQFVNVRIFRESSLSFFYNWKHTFKPSNLILGGLQRSLHKNIVHIVITRNKYMSIKIIMIDYWLLIMKRHAAIKNNKLEPYLLRIFVIVIFNFVKKKIRSTDESLKELAISTQCILALGIRANQVCL